MFNPIRDKEEQTTLFNQIYRGKVIDNEDPLKAGRVRVEVFGVFDGISESILPWAIMADITLSGLQEVGSSFIPEKDSHVFVFFEGGDHRFPVYFAGAPALHNEEIPDLPFESRRDTPDLESEEYEFPLKDESGFPFDDKEEKDGSSVYPFNKVFKTKSGFVIEIDDTEENTRFRFKQPNGNEKVVDHNGHVEEVVKGNVSELFFDSHMSKIQKNRFEHVEGDHVEKIEGDKEETVKGDSNFTVEGDHVEKIERDKEETIKGDLDITVKSDKILSIQGDYDIIVNGNCSIDVSGNTDVTSGGMVNVNGTMINLNSG